MEKDIKALLLGRAIGLASKGHRYEVGKLLDSYPEVFKPIITGLLTGEIGFEYELTNRLIKLGEEMGYDRKLLLDDKNEKNEK